MNLKLKKVYTVSKKGKPEKPRLFLQHLVCEAAGFKVKGEVYIKINGLTEEVVLQNFPFEDGEDVHTVHVACRKSKISGKERPLVDTAGDKYCSFLDINQKIEVNVYKQGNKGQVIIRPLEYKLFENSTIPTPRNERIKLLSICAGAGVGTSVLEDTGYFTPVQEIELEDDSAEVLLHNFPNSTVFCGDLRDCQDIAEVDMAFITAPCSEHSSLGFQEGNVMNDLVLATAKIIQSSKAEVLFFENVPQYYKSNAWESLKNLLKDDYPFWGQKELEAWDFGSLATRKRTYAVAFKDEKRFLSFDFPAAPKLRRKKLKDFLDRSSVQHEWKSVRKFMDSFNSREAWKDRSLDLTFVGKDAEKIQCIPKRYTSQCASNSHVLSDDGENFRFLSIEEIKRIMGIPDHFSFTENIQKIRKYEMLGQSVDGRIIKAIANRLAYTFMKVKTKAATTTETLKKNVQSYNVNNCGQLELLLS
ncbi:DNA cytosine methyltransferase [Cytobacillus firmus]|uniref:DNA cytosine methyltransferase n=1 Tax=Cytobacillus firmus TaxID=1399 RepID=UPI00203F3692|nr:DNA cytosine methyltransferase [Cytobacillus firmus]MCM3707336.1 DNA cytosine methyltransferase [Cytobacillus firmus]